MLARGIIFSKIYKKCCHEGGFFAIAGEGVIGVLVDEQLIY